MERLEAAAREGLRSDIPRFEPGDTVRVQVRVPRAPRVVRSVRGQQNLPSTFVKGILTFTVNVEEADYILLLN